MINSRPIAKFATKLPVMMRLLPAVPSPALLLLTLVMPAGAADNAPAPLSPDYFGAVLLLIGVALVVAEAHVGAFGVIGGWGIAAFVVGVLMVFPSLAPGIVLPHLVVAAMAVGGVALLIDAKNDRAARWYQSYGALALDDAPLSLVLPLATVAGALERGI